MLSIEIVNAGMVDCLGTDKMLDITLQITCFTPLDTK